jgi:hypothetical protein
MLSVAVVVCRAWAGPLVWVETRDAESEEPLAGALVTVAGSDIIATTDATGRCPLVVPVGRGSMVVVARAGFFDDTLSVGRRFRHDTVIVAWLHPDRPRAVRVVVNDAVTGTPLAGVTVRLQDKDSVLTRGDGSALLSDFPPGSWLVRAEMDGWQADSQSVSARGGETTDVALRLRDTTNVGMVSGDVRDENGAPVAGAAVRLEVSGLVALSDSAGHYVFERLPAGVYNVSVSKAGYCRGVARFRVLKGWTVNLNLRLASAP